MVSYFVCLIFRGNGTILRGVASHPHRLGSFIALLVKRFYLVSRECGHADGLDAMLKLAMNATAGCADESTKVENNILIATSSTVEAAPIARPPLNLFKEFLIFFFQFLRRHTAPIETG